MALTTVSPGLLDSNAQYYAFKNRIINGAMVIDQRNAGASVTVNSANNFFAVDRFAGSGQVTDGVFTLQRSTVAPAGFTNSLLATVTTADASLGATQQYIVGQNIEGFNIADLGWGATGAQSVTLSFWVRSSVTGVFGGSIVNSGFNRSYPFTFSISSANTFEYKTVTIAGDTSGTWLTDNGVGLRLIFSLGAGSTYTGTAGAWDGSYKAGATGQVNLIATNGATFYITGVQLEKGSTATSFDYRPYGTELALCQRYFEKSVSQGTAIQTSAQATFYGNMQSSIANGIWYLTVPFVVTKRAAPTVTTYPYTTATNTGRFSNNVGTDYGANSAAAGGIYDSQFNVQNNSGGTLSTGSGIVFGSWFASAEL